MVVVVVVTSPLAEMEARRETIFQIQVGNLIKLM